MKVWSTMRRDAGSHRRAWRLGALACIALAGTACMEGYPTADVPTKSPSQMNPRQLLNEMNRLGKQPHLGQRWRYRLKPGCVLEVTVRRDAGGTEAIAVPLDQAAIEVRVDDADKTFDVQVRTSVQTGEAAPLSVLEGGKWTDSVGMRSLLQHLQHRCGELDEPRT